LDPCKDKHSLTNKLDDVACDFPALTIILGHAGRPNYEQTALLLRKHKSVYAEIGPNSARMEEFKHTPFKRPFFETKTISGNVGKLLFGSGYPFYSRSETVAALEQAS
jgi:predicted TIM-barrel fold metal-dependent hydrolase